MKAEISNIADLKAKRFTSVVYQLSRMRTDWDDNAAEQIRKNLLNSVSLTVLGTGTPSHDGLIVQTQASGQPMQLALGATGGRVVADGVVGELMVRSGEEIDPANGPYQDQTDLELAGTPVLRKSLGKSDDANAKGYILYCDVWDKTVTAFDDKELPDVALHGADTTAREQRCTQLKIAKAGDLIVDGSDPCKPAFIPERIPGIGDGIFDLSLNDQTISPDDCDPCATIIDIDEEVGNHLFRLEVHHVDYDPDDRRPNRLVLKYSKENGARRFSSDVAPEPQFVYEHFSAEAEQLMGMPSDDWDTAKLYDPGEPEKSFRGVFRRTPVASKEFVRRWDAFVDLSKSGGNWKVDHAEQGDGGTISFNVEGGTLTLIFDGMTLTLELRDKRFLAGDAWYALLRNRASSSPVDQRIKVVSKTPLGIRHYYCILGRVNFAFGRPKAETDGTIKLLDDTLTPNDRRRLQFPSLTCLGAEDVGYDNSACEMPSVATVQDAIDHLCQERDLSWHNKHLHGWGIVCGLIVECGPDTDPDADSPDTESTRRQIRLTPGYALDCKGNDINLDNEQIIDLLERIEKFQSSTEKLLIENGEGSVCLFLDRDRNGQPEIRLEPYDPSRNGFASILEGTLLKDFYDECIVKIIDALKDEIKFLDRDDLDRVEAAEGSLVSAQRRKLTSISNLIIQIFNSGNGAFVFLSLKEHLILKSFYLRLLQLLQSETFCAMFRDQDFPDYPFDDLGTTTYFGKNNHTRIKSHPLGKRVYTYGGADNTINVYDVAKGELIEVIEMPSAEGAEVSAIAFSPSGDLLYAAASVRGVDSVFGLARIGSDSHAWKKMTILCDIEITEMEVSAGDPSLLHAIGRGKGLYFLRPEVLLDQTKPEVIPAFAFKAVGHLAIDQAAGLAYATSSRALSADGPDFYDQIVILDLKKEPDPSVIPPFLTLQDEDDVALEGDDGLALRPGGVEEEKARLYVVVGGVGGSRTKQLLTYQVITGRLPVPISALEIENTDIALAYHTGKDKLLLSLEDGYRLQAFSPDGEATEVSRIPAQIQPVDLTVDRTSGQVYALNFVSNTVTAIPADELQVSNDFLNKLAAYRRAILAAFVGLLGGLLQYLKDCFCHHLLVKCPTSRDDDKIYLACVEIRENKVYKICNFDKRKYVKSFPTVDYWMSLVPVLPAIRWAVEKLCCSVMPDLFGKSMFDSVLRPAAVAADKTAAPNRVNANTVRKGLRTFQRTDVKTIFRDQTKSVKLVGRLIGDNFLTLGGAGRRPVAGVKKQALLGIQVDDAVKELKRNKIEVDRVVAYDPGKAGQYITRFTSTPQRVKRGERVVLHEKDGKVLFYSTVPTVAAVTIPEELTAKLDSLEGRKTELADFASIVTKLEEVETRRAEVVELGRVRADLNDLSAEREAVKNQLSALKLEVASVRKGREREAAQLKALKGQRAKFSTDLTKLNKEFRDVNVMHKALRLEIAKDRPVTSIQGVTPQIALKLRASGVLTVGDLSKATPVQLKGINANTAKAIKRRAGDRIKSG